MAVFGRTNTLAFIMMVVLLPVRSHVMMSPVTRGPTVSWIEVVDHTKFTKAGSDDSYVNLTVGVFGEGLGNNTLIRPTSRIALRGSECYKNHPAKSIDSENHIFKMVCFFRFFLSTFPIVH